DGLQRVFEGKVAVLEQLQLLVELLERLFVGELLAHVSTSSTLAPIRPDASRMRTRRLTFVAAAERMTVPDSASSVMLQPRARTPSGLSAARRCSRWPRARVAPAKRSARARSSLSTARRDANEVVLRASLEVA